MNSTNTLLLTALTSRIKFAAKPIKFAATVKLSAPVVRPVALAALAA